MKTHGSRMRSVWLRVGVFLVLGVSLGALAQPPSFKLRGRKPGSQEPWDAFLGKAAHMAIGYQYIKQYPSPGVFLDSTLSYILERSRLENPKRLPEFVRHLRPDITDTSALMLFEVKPDHEEGRQEGREQAERYLAALNSVIARDKQLKGGTGFEGSLFLEFEHGGALWQLSWRTPEPGVTLYRWSYRRRKPGASWQERVAQKEESLPREEAERHGELAEQVLRAAYEQGELPHEFQGQVYLPVDCH